MLDTLLLAATHFLKHQLEIEGENLDPGSAMRTVIASIDIEPERAKPHRIYVACSDGMISRIGTCLLGEEIRDEATRNDMALETANLVVGSAKVIARERLGLNMTIGTPRFDGYALFEEECDIVRALGSEGRIMIIGIKEL